MTKGLFVLCKSSLLVAWFAMAAFAQNSGKISGVVTDIKTGERLVGVNVILVGTNLGASTDIEGSYFILNVPPGKYDLQGSSVGYERVVQRGLIVNSGRTTKADVALKATLVEKEEVVVEATRPDVEPDKTSTSMIIRTDDVQQLAGMRNVGDVLGLAADVMDGHFRGGRSNEELFVLQGMGITNPLDNSRAIVPIMSAVEEVEVTTSGFGAQYGNAQSGVVNITMKEGKSDKWRSYVETRLRLPSKKHFGSSPYDISTNPYLQTFSSLSNWRSAYGSVITNQLGKDSALQIAVAKSVWDMARRGINQEYGNLIDYSGEVATGGPINEHMRMFVAFSNNTENPTFTTEHPDASQQVMGNIVADVGSVATLRLSGAYAQTRTNSFSLSGLGYYGFLYNMVTGIQYRNTTNLQLGIRYTHAISQKTFYEIKLNMLDLHNRQGSTPFTPDSLLHTIVNTSWAGKPNPQPDYFREGFVNETNNEEKTMVYSLDASMTSQLARSHLLNAGIQVNAYTITVNDVSNRSVDGIARYNTYDAKPLEAGLYVQDKMEFEGMIANVGLRWDLWDQNSHYQPNLFTNQWVDSGKAKTPIIGRLQPRVGISFPVSVSTVFHMNYGTFMQRPAFQYVFQNQPGDRGVAEGSGTFGNSALKPQVTYMYDVGVTQGLGEGFTVDASGYYKSVKDLIETAIYDYYNTQGSATVSGTYTGYVNRDYADIRGFRLAASKRQGNLTGTINYQYSVATGKSSGVGNAAPIVHIDNEDTKNIPRKDILLDFDRTHNLIIQLSYRTDEQFGFAIRDVYPLGNMMLAVSYSARSGRPYTYNTTGESGGASQTMNMRMPAEYNLNLKLTKRIDDFFGTSASIYLEVFNVFNNRILNYGYITGLSGTYATLYQTKPIDALDGIRYINTTIATNPQYGVDQSFMLYANDPRSINLGFTVVF